MSHEMSGVTATGRYRRQIMGSALQAALDATIRTDWQTMQTWRKRSHEDNMLAADHRKMARNLWYELRTLLRVRRAGRTYGD